MLHLGCGAGGHDFYFKQHFSVTGVDLSEGMLEIAKKMNQEIKYLKGDMRNVKLNEKFNAVVIPDSIMYMSTLKDLSDALINAAAHMKPDGVLLVVAHTKEEFRNNNFVYIGEDENIHITVLENNHIISDSTT
jgi:predicted TPR repeat methyltransferase